MATAVAPFTGAALGAPLPPIRHVFVVMLENQPFDDTFGAKSQMRYLKGLPQHGALAVNYFATSHASLGNYLALISGQAPNESTNLDCEVYSEFVSTGLTPDGQAIGKGCVYPPTVKTLANQLEAANLTWKGYMEDMGNNPRRESATCGHPPIGAPDNTQEAEVGDQYAARHNPFVYFHAIIDNPSCDRHVLNLAALAPDLKSVATTPNYTFIVPNLCHDAHDGTGGGRCVDGAPGGLVAADEFLSHLVPKILASPAYRRDGLLIITFDEADIAGD
jgi:phospholipase C